LDKGTCSPNVTIRPVPGVSWSFSLGSTASIMLDFPRVVNARASQSLIPPLTVSRAVCGLKTEIPEAAHFNKEA